MEPYLTILKERGYKITPLRKAIIEAFRKKRATLTAEALLELIRHQIPRAGLQSIYRNLADFTGLGIIEEIFLEKRRTAFALCNGFSLHHHHAVCRRCGRSEEINPCDFDSLSETANHSFRMLEKKSGFQVERHFVQLEGLCRACQKD